MKIIYSKIKLPPTLALPIEGEKKLAIFYKHLVKNILVNYQRFKRDQLNKSQFENFIKNDMNFEYTSEIGDVIYVNHTDDQSAEANLVELTDLVEDVRDHGFDKSSEKFLKSRLIKKR